MSRLERDLEGQAQVLRLNVGSPVGRQLAAQYRVRGVPTFLVFNGSGQVIHVEVGRLDAERLKTEIESLGR